MRTAQITHRYIMVFSIPIGSDALEPQIVGPNYPFNNSIAHLRTHYRERPKRFHRISKRGDEAFDVVERTGADMIGIVCIIAFRNRLLCSMAVI